jgi:hypothetical protein
MKNESVQRESIHIAPTLPLVLRKVGGYSKTSQQEEKERFRGVSGSSFSLGTFQGFHFWPLHEPRHQIHPLSSSPHTANLTLPLLSTQPHTQATQAQTQEQVSARRNPQEAATPNMTPLAASNTPSQEQQPALDKVFMRVSLILVAKF